MRYHEMSRKKLHFIVTPDELRSILKDYHHVVVSRGVPKDYVESDPNNFFVAYDALYDNLKNGARLIWNRDRGIAHLCTGITAHLENCIYKAGDRSGLPKFIEPLCLQDFIEPCPFIETFCFFPWRDQLSTSFSVEQFPENTCGLCLDFPSKIEYEIDTEKHAAGIVECTRLDDFETYETLVNRIKSLTKPLKLDFDGKIRRTAVRISDDAKKDLSNFYFITSNDITVV